LSCWFWSPSSFPALPWQARPRPAETANPLLRLLYVVVNALGFNAGKARNADDALAVATKKATASDSRAAAAKAAKL